MKRFGKCCQISKIVSALIYVISLPFLTLFFLHTTIPLFEIAHNILTYLFFIAVAFAVIKIILSVFIKYKICKYEKRSGKKLSTHEIIHLL
jgi:hypothetical protein